MHHCYSTNTIGCHRKAICSKYIIAIPKTHLGCHRKTVRSKYIVTTLTIACKGIALGFKGEGKQEERGD